MALKYLLMIWQLCAERKLLIAYWICLRKGQTETQVRLFACHYLPSFHQNKWMKEQWRSTELHRVSLTHDIQSTLEIIHTVKVAIGTQCRSCMVHTTRTNKSFLRETEGFTPGKHAEMSDLETICSMNRWYMQWHEQASQTIISSKGYRTRY